MFNMTPKIMQIQSEIQFKNMAIFSRSDLTKTFIGDVNSATYRSPKPMFLALNCYGYEANSNHRLSTVK